MLCNNHQVKIKIKIHQTRKSIKKKRNKHTHDNTKLEKLLQVTARPYLTLSEIQNSHTNPISPVWLMFL